MKPVKLVKVLTLAFVASLALACVTNDKPNAAQAKPLVPDSSVVSGKLENGLSFIIQQNDDPKGRLYIRLVVKAGSLEETDAEGGAAHFLEHMAFNGTKSFPKNELVKYFESTGMKFGDALNAGTSFDYTEYELEVPSDNPAYVATAFKIAREWADGITLDPEEVVKERGVILEEERSRRSAGDRVWKQQAPAVYGESLYRREIVGTPESISSMTAEKLRAFYKRYYRPDLMAVVVVGDLPKADLEKQVRSEFASLEKREGPALASRDIGPLPGLRTSAVSDAELTTLSLELGSRIRDTASKFESDTVAKFRRYVALDLLGNRFSDAIRRSGGKTVSSASVDVISLGGDDAAINYTASTSGKTWSEALDFVKTELARAAQYGFSKEEIERVKSSVMVGLEDVKKNGYSSASLTGKLVSWFLYDTVPISIDDRLRLYGQAFSTYTNDEAKAIVAALLKPESGYFLLSMPDSAGLDLAEKTLTDAVLQPTAKVTPWVSEKAASGLAGIVPAAVAPIAVTERKELGLVDFTYPNGIRVLLKKTDFEEDEIFMAFGSWGGSDSLSDVEYANVMIAANLIPASGYAGISAEALKSMLADKNVSFSASVGDMTTSMGGTANRKDLETLFQLARRTMTDPIIDDGYMAMVKKQLTDFAATFTNNPGRVFSAEISKSVFPSLPRLLTFSKPGDVALLDIDVMKKSFTSFFCPPKGGVLTLSGSFDIDAARALCDKYIGSLPTGGPAQKPAVLQASKPVTGKTSVTVKAGVEDKAQVVFIYKTPVSDVDMLTVFGLDYLAASLDRTLRERIREDKGGTYGVSVASVTDTKREYTQISVSFEADPKRVAELAPIVAEEVAKLTQTGVPQAVIDEVRLATKRDLAVASEKNGFWITQLTEAALENESLDIMGALEATHAAVSTEWTKKAAVRYLDPANLAMFTLLPAEKK